MTIDIETIIRNAQEAVGIQELADGSIYAVRGADGALELLSTPAADSKRARDRERTAPARVARRVTVRDADSLTDYLAHNTIGVDDEVNLDYQHGPGELEVWSNIDQRRIVAILDGGGGHRGHIAILELRHSAEWAEWAGIDGKLMDQVRFAEFIEDHLSSIGAPNGAELLDIAQTLTAKTKVDFKSSLLLGNGQRQFEFAETIEAKAGVKGTLKIPTELTLVVRPFQGDQPVALQARFRFRITEGQLLLGVKLIEPDKALEVAFDRVIQAVQAQVPVRVNHGTA